MDLTDPEDSLSENEDDIADEQDGDEMKNDEDESDDEEQDGEEDRVDQEVGSEDDEDDDSDDDIPLGLARRTNRVGRARRMNAMLSSSDDEEGQGRYVNWTRRKRQNVST